MMHRTNQVSYGAIGMLVRKHSCAGADDCLELSTEKTEREFLRFLREFVLYLSAMALAEIQIEQSAGPIQAATTTWEKLREAVLFGEEADQRMRALLPSFLAAVCLDERLSAYLQGDLGGLGMSLSELELFAEEGLPKPNDERAAKSFYAFAVRMLRMYRSDSSTNSMAAQFAAIQRVLKRHADAFHADLRGVLLTEG